MIIIREKKKPLREKLEPATSQQFGLLQKQIDADPELRRMLTTPMKEIAQYYWIYEEYGRHYVASIEDLSLLSVLEIFFQQFKQNPLIFSKVGNKFIGFIFYKKEERAITAIKAASFYDDRKKSNPVLAFDLINFIEKNLPYYDKIIWTANASNNWAVQQYDASLKKKGLIYTKLPDERNKDMVVYTVTGKAD